MPMPATLWPLPFSLPFSRGKGKRPQERGERSKDGFSRKPWRAMQKPDAEMKRGLGKLASESRRKAQGNAAEDTRNVEILERFGNAAPRPRGKPRGTQRARGAAIKAPPTEIFKAHGQAGNHRLEWFCVETAPRKLRTTFFRSVFLVGVSGQSGRRGAPEAPAPPVRLPWAPLWPHGVRHRALPRQPDF